MRLRRNLNGRGIMPDAAVAAENRLRSTDRRFEVTRAMCAFGKS
jgi:hypothetical protein